EGAHAPLSRTSLTPLMPYHGASRLRRLSTGERRLFPIIPRSACVWPHTNEDENRSCPFSSPSPAQRCGDPAEPREAKRGTRVLRTFPRSQAGHPGPADIPPSPYLAWEGAGGGASPASCKGEESEPLLRR